MRVVIVLGAVLTVMACDDQTVDPCPQSESKPVLEIVAVRDPATGTSGAALALSSITLDGVPVDTSILRTHVLRNVERTEEGIACTVPCSFGQEPGIYSFDVLAPGFYQGHDEVSAAYTNVPDGCPASHGDPTPHSVNLIEADSARVIFSYTIRNGTGLAGGIVGVTFDDGTGARSVMPMFPWQSFVTRNSGTLHIEFVVGAPDTIAVGDLDLPLNKDWEWAVRAFIYDHNPMEDSFCVEAKSFPLRRAVPNADSLYIAWSGLPLSRNAAC